MTSSCNPSCCVNRVIYVSVGEVLLSRPRCLLLYAEDPLKIFLRSIKYEPETLYAPKKELLDSYFADASSNGAFILKVLRQGTEKKAWALSGTS